MSRISLILLISLLSLLPGGLHAQVLIDSFFDNSGDYNATFPPSSGTTSITINGQVASRELIVSATGTATAETTVQSGNWLTDGTAASSDTFNSQNEYSFSTLDLNGSPYLQISVNTVSGTSNLSLVLQNASSGTVLGGIQLTSADDNTTLVFDVRQLSGYTAGFLDNVNVLDLGIGVAGQTSFVTINNIEFSPVPEPSTLMLLGIGMVGLLAYYRRRQKSAVAAD